MAANSSRERSPSSPAISANFSARRSAILSRMSSRAASRSSAEISPSPSVSIAARRSSRAARRASRMAWRSSSSITPSSLTSYCWRNSGRVPSPNERPSSSARALPPKRAPAIRMYFSFIVLWLLGGGPFTGLTKGVTRRSQIWLQKRKLFSRGGEKSAKCLIPLGFTAREDQKDCHQNDLTIRRPPPLA